MNKKILILFVLFLFVILVGCNEEIEEKKYVVKFDSNCSLTYPDIELNKPGQIQLPEPEKKGYVFKGWFPSEDYIAGTEVTAETIIGKNVTLHAKWQSIRVKVTYDLQGGSLSDSKYNYVYVYSDQKLALSRAYLEDHIFVGWFIGEQQITDEYEYLEDTTLTAKYISLSELEPTYKVTLNLNGGYYYPYMEANRVQTTIQQSWKLEGFAGYWTEYEFVRMVTDFMNDYFTFTSVMNGDLDKTFYDVSVSKLIGYNGFLGEEKYFNKWIWMFEYLVTIAHEDNKQAIQDLIDGKYTNSASDYGKEQYCIRAEVEGFFKGTKFTRTERNGVTYQSADYSNKELLYGFKSSITPQMDESTPGIGIIEYETGKGIVLLSPRKDGAIFEGWYTNPEFTGEKVTEILYNSHEDVVLYAKWGK